MPFTTDTELVSAITDTLHRDDIDDAAVRDWIRLTELSVQRKVELRDIDARADVTFTAGDSYTLPSDWIRLRQITMAQDGPQNIQLISIHQAETQRYRQRDSGPVTYAFVDGNDVYFIPSVTTDVDGVIWYTARTTDLSTQNSNWLLENAPDVYFYGALTHSAPYIGEDERIPVWNAFYANALESLEEMVWDGKFTGMANRSKPDFAVPQALNIARQTR